MAPALEATQAVSAEILEAGGFQSLAVSQAMGKVRAVLSSGPARSRKIYAVIVRGEHGVESGPSHLRVVATFLEAYWRGWRTLSRIAGEQQSSLKMNQIRNIKESGDIRFYWGQKDANEVREKMSASPGVYVIPSHLDNALLKSLGLPSLPEAFREEPLVIQLKLPDPPSAEREASEDWSPWKTLMDGIKEKDEIEAEIDRDTLAWRKRFVSEYSCWTAAEVAQESSSQAKNRSSIASRWLSEGRIFSVQFGRKVLFPKFQFQHGNPIPVISKVLKEFPKGATGWDYAFFFTSANTYLGGRKPVELLKKDPEELVSLARSFANPADAF